MRYDDDDYRISRASGPSWLGVILTSLLTSVVVLVAFLWALQHGFVMVPALSQKAQAPASSSNAAHVAVPPLTGLSTATALELLSARGLRLVVRQKRANPAPVDTVIAQDPLADSRLPRDAQVVVVLSSGPSASSTVPDLAGKPLADALKELESAGLKADELAPDAGVPRVVTGSEPAAGKTVERGSAVKLLLAPAGVELPKLVGISLTKAKKSLAELGLTLGKLRARYDEEAAAYLVLSQTPAPGTRVAPGSSVDLVYSEE
jgi:serine/threonine-protein kinase